MRQIAAGLFVAATIMTTAGVTRGQERTESRPNAECDQELTELRRASGAQYGADVPIQYRFLFDGFVLHGCSTAVWETLPDSIVLERTRCFGFCPAYKVTFRRAEEEVAEGPAELEATFVGDLPQIRRFPETTGEFTGRIDIFVYARLAYLIEKSEFSRWSRRF